ncbi:hypothetical protein [Natrinema halophilum]|uniref:Uncharacterized protein n=1 Tax=Natrinema halophilum TaxID=1699371 RepID=A0A7D5GUJ6_9EURY|nr:hypothetical protein [Natrinema halophilum]QLG50126.1 hypothetical protein HYG82_15305 [Natrinema halophilum]
MSERGSSERIGFPPVLKGGIPSLRKMDRTNVDYLYSFDTDFDAIDGLVRLTAPSNPFT